jgi:hypothetical protein
MLYDGPTMPADPNQEWDVSEWESRGGYRVRLSWFGMTPQFRILGTDIPPLNSLVELNNAIDQLIKGEEAMQKQPTPPATDALKARADFLATHLTALAHFAEINRRRETECI